MLSVLFAAVAALFLAVALIGMRHPSTQAPERTLFRWMAGGQGGTMLAHLALLVGYPQEYHALIFTVVFVGLVATFLCGPILAYGIPAKQVRTKG